ncbi:MAG: hypothetical protein ACRDSL_14570 [Pseudonocardiaceae bacterium]
MWEVIDTLLIVRDAEPGLADDTLVAATGEATGLPERKVRTAVRYYTMYRDDIDEGITANRQAAREAEAAWQAEQDLLRGTDRAS